MTNIFRPWATVSVVFVIFCIWGVNISCFSRMLCKIAPDNLLERINVSIRSSQASILKEIGSIESNSSGISLSLEGPQINVDVGSTNVDAASLLYFPATYDNPLYKFLNDGKLAPLTRWAQSFIHNHQHPAQCDRSRILISKGRAAGFGSEMHVIGAHLAYAIQNNLVLVLGPTSCSNFKVPHDCNKGCDCLFHPISSCGNDIGIFDDPTVETIEAHVGKETYMVDIFRDALRSQIPSMTDGQIKYWWRGQSAAYLMRFNDVTINAIAALRHTQSMHYITNNMTLPFPLPPGTISAYEAATSSWK